MSNTDRCTGTDCPGCEAGRRHYLATGCLDSSCPRDHGALAPLAIHEGDTVEVTIRDKPEIEARRGRVTKVEASGEFFVAAEDFAWGHWYGGDGSNTGPEGDSTFIIRKIE